MSNIAVILAGGSGKRFGSPTPKQFLTLAGKAVIEHSIDTFCQHPAIDEVAVVVHPDYRDTMQVLSDRRGWDKMKRIIDGGAERYESSLNAIRAYNAYPDDTRLLLHDAARPLLSAETIGRVITALENHDAVGVGLPSTDTVWEVENGCIDRIPERRKMWRAQTPQAFRLSALSQAYEHALKDPLFAATDDCGVLKRYMPLTDIFVVEGDERNIKITTAGDLKLAEALIAS